MSQFFELSYRKACSRMSPRALGMCLLVLPVITRQDRAGLRNNGGFSWVVQAVLPVTQKKGDKSSSLNSPVPPSPLIFCDKKTDKTQTLSHPTLRWQKLVNDGISGIKSCTWRCVSGNIRGPALWLIVVGKIKLEAIHMVLYSKVSSQLHWDTHKEEI